MGLKITYLDQDSLKAELDNFFPFTIARHGDLLIARVAGWRHEMPGGEVTTAAQMRTATYTAVARYREHQRALHAAPTTADALNALHPASALAI